MNNENNNAAFETAVNSTPSTYIDYVGFLKASMAVSRITRSSASIDEIGDAQQRLISRWMWLHSTRASGPRWSGKTQAIVELVRPNDVVVVLNDSRRVELRDRLYSRNPNIPDKIRVYTPAELVKCKRDPLIEGAAEANGQLQIFIDDSTYLQYNFQLKDVLKGLATKLDSYDIDLFLIG